MTGLSALKDIGIDRQGLLRKAGLSFLILFYLFSFISKSAVNIMGGLLLLISLIYIGCFKRDIIRNNRYLLILLLPYFIGFFLSFFSLAGFNGALGFLNRYKFILMLIPLTAFIENKKNLNYMFAALATSAVVASVYVIYNHINFHGFKSFLVIGRFADMLVVVILVNIVFFFKTDFGDIKKNLIFKGVNFVVTGLFVWCLLLTYIRGAWLGFFFAIAVFAIFFCRKLLVLLAIGVLLITVMPIKNNAFNTLKSEVVSIIDTENDVSNVERLHIWKTGLDFSRDYLCFGTGAKNAEEAFKTFWSSKSEEYQKKYHHAAKYSGNMHNSYLQIIVESGIFYFLMYCIGLLYVLTRILKNMKKVKNNEKSYIIIALISTIGFLVPQFFHGELYSYGVNTYYMTLFGACFITNGYVNWYGKLDNRSRGGF